MTREEFLEAVRRLLDAVSTMTLSTCAGEIPWATDVYFAPDGFDLVFWSSPHSRHCRNLEVNPRCAATIHPVVASWQEIRGLQMEGVCRPVAGVAATARAAAAYFRKFPFARALLADPAGAAAAVIKAAPQILQPSRLLYLDNALGFGARFALSWHDGSPVGLPQREPSG
jgi:uncharacterized protein YhbP (UPF0306 family)